MQLDISARLTTQVNNHLSSHEKSITKKKGKKNTKIWGTRLKPTC